MTSPPTISATDRLGLILFVAASLHALVILGVSFDAEDLSKLASKPLDIVLVHSQGEKPEQADYLAQADQRGGGNVQERVRPSSRHPNPRPVTERGDAAQTRQASAPPPVPEQPRTVVTTRGDSPVQTPDAPTRTRTPPAPELPSADQLVAQSFEQARLSAVIEQNQQAYAQKPRQEWVTANTRQHDSAAYEDSWREKVERIGNLNYPDEAKRRHLSGALILDVAIYPDGSLAGIKVLRSSGSKVLDDGAIRIVEIAAPFSAFPPSMKKRLDILHIVRVWQFQSDNRLSTRQ